MPHGVREVPGTVLSLAHDEKPGSCGSLTQCPKRNRSAPGIARAARDWAWFAALCATVAAIVLAPLSTALAGRDRPERRMSFQSERQTARRSLKSEVKPESTKEEETPGEAAGPAQSSSDYSFSATGDSKNPHSARQVFKHNNP
jgi:hypothetical protein